jgi:hypothetical protein
MMKHLLQQFWCIIITIAPLALVAQDSTRIAYTRDYEFKEGLYLTIDMFIHNTPLSKADIITDIPKEKVDFWASLVKGKTISYTDVAGLKQEIEIGSVWGYCQNRIVHIYYNKQFARTNVIGTLCQFAATVTSTVTYYNPMFPGSPIMGGGYSTTNVQEMRQFVYNTKNGQTLELTPKNLEIFLQDDDELYKEYMNLKRKQRNDLVFFYLRKYNERNPLYLPAY